MNRGTRITSAAGGFSRHIISLCGVLALGFAVSAMAATAVSSTSFSPVFVKDGAGKLQTLTWTYTINNGNPLAVEDAKLGSVTFQCSDLNLTINPLAKTRVGAFSAAIAGDATGSATAAFTESLEALANSVNVKSQQVNIGVNVSVSGLPVSILVNLLTQFSPASQWSLDRPDLDLLGVGYEWSDETQGDTTGSVKITVPLLGSQTQAVDYSGSVPDSWVIVDVLDQFQVGTKTYRKVVVLERTTQVPTGDTSGTVEEAVLTYWVAQGVGMIKGVGQYQFMGQPLEIALKSSTLSQPPPALFPDWAWGTFNGYVEGGGSATMSVTAQGKVTGKVSFGGTNYTLSAAASMAGSAADGFSVVATAKVGRAALPLEVRVTQAAAPQGPGVAAGQLGDGPQVVMWRDVGKDAGGPLAPYTGYYTATLPGGAEYGSGCLTFTADKFGKVKVAGKLADGTAVSLSGTLILDAEGRVFAVLYASPAAYKGGMFFGLAEFVKPEAGLAYLRPLDGWPCVWESRSPQATSVYGEAFQRELVLNGGWYSKTGNLYDYYRDRELTAGTDDWASAPELTVGVNRYASEVWNPNGLALAPVFDKKGLLIGLAAPKAGLPAKNKDGTYDYEAAGNTIGLKCTLTRATGVFKGSFKAWFDYPVKKHVSKSIAYEGVLTPEREDKADGVEGRGFFLWPDKAVPPAPAKPYSFKWSYDFTVLMSEPL